MAKMDENDINISKKTSERPKQLLIVLTIFTFTLITTTSTGIYAGRHNDEGLSVFLSGAGVILMLILTKWKGRRILFMTLFILSVMSSIIYLCHLESIASWYKIICLSVHASVEGSAIALPYIVICEYCDPKRRFLFLIVNSAIQRCFFWPPLILQDNYNLNYLCEYFQYFNIILGLFGLWSVLKWPESPYWLASKGRYEEITKAFVEVRGGSELNEELQVLIDARARPKSVKMIYAPILIALPVICMCIHTFDIVLVYETFALDVTQNSSFTVIHSITFLALQCVSALASVLTVLIPLALPRKVLLLSCGFLFASEFCVIFTSHEMRIPVVGLIYDAIVNFGPRTVALPLLIELVPQKFMYSLTLFITLVSIFMESVFVGSLLGPFVLVLVIICYFIMPEVKEKTLIEIEQSYVFNKKEPQPIVTDL